MTAALAGIRAAILCGGRGVRLKPMTDAVPKAMVPVRGRPMVDHIVDFYRAAGVAQFTLCVGYRGDDIRGHYRRPPAGCAIAFSDAGADASMLQRLWAARDAVGERFIVAYCDTFIDLDTARFRAAHEASGAAATIVTAGVRNPFGVVSMNADGWVERFDEKPRLDYYIGCFLMQRSAFDMITEAMLAMPDGGGLVAFFGALIARGRLAGFDHEGLQLSFNTPSEHQAAETALARYYTYAEGQ